jgi:hypothetical protein
MAPAEDLRHRSSFQYVRSKYALGVSLARKPGSLLLSASRHTLITAKGGTPETILYVLRSCLDGHLSLFGRRPTSRCESRRAARAFICDLHKSDLCFSCRSRFDPRCSVQIPTTVAWPACSAYSTWWAKTGAFWRFRCLTRKFDFQNHRQLSCRFEVRLSCWRHGASSPDVLNLDVFQRLNGEI